LCITLQSQIRPLGDNFYFFASSRATRAQEIGLLSVCFPLDSGQYMAEAAELVRVEKDDSDLSPWRSECCYADR